MKNVKRVLPIYISIFLLIGYVPGEGAKVKEKKTEEQYKLQYIAWALQIRRVHRVGYNILKKNVEITEDRKKGTRYDLGIYAASEVEFPKDIRRVLRKYFNLGEGLTVVNVISESSADKAGVKAGDKLLKINGIAIRSYPITFVESARAAKNRFYSLTNKFFIKTGKINLTVERKGTEHTFNIVPELICSANLNVEVNLYNAYVTAPKNIVVGIELAKHLESNDQLALAIGHELAHITCYHIGKKRIGSIAGTLVGASIPVPATLAGALVGEAASHAGAVIGGNVFSHKYELEADYIGLYNVVRAGYDIQDAPFFFRRTVTSGKVAVGGYKSTKGSLSHPSNEERFLKLSKAAKEIHEKKAKGQVLVPDYKAFTSN